MSTLGRVGSTALLYPSDSKTGMEVTHSPAAEISRPGDGSAVGGASVTMVVVADPEPAGTDVAGAVVAEPVSATLVVPAQPVAMSAIAARPTANRPIGARVAVRLHSGHEIAAVANAIRAFYKDQGLAIDDSGSFTMAGNSEVFSTVTVIETGDRTSMILSWAPAWANHWIGLPRATLARSPF